MTSTAYVLVGMGLRDAHERDRLAAWATEFDASIAYLQVGSPGLGQELTRLASQGHARVVVVGVNLGRKAPGVSWLRRIAAHWWREYGGTAPTVFTASTLLENADNWPDVVASTRPVTGREAGLTSAAWEEVPRHRHQVFVCRGPRCTAAGAEETAEALVGALAEHGLGDDDVLVTQTGCQFPCNHAPVITVHPDDVWYGKVVASEVTDMVTEHLLTGCPVARLRLR